MVRSAVGAADVIASQQGFESGEGFRKTIGIAQAGIEEVELMGTGTGGCGFQHYSCHGALGREILQMGVEYTEEKFHIAARFGNTEFALIGGAIEKAQGQGQATGDQPRGGESPVA